MDHFMYNDVFQGLRRFLRQFKVDPDSTFILVTRPPTRFHPPNSPIPDIYSHNGLPLFDKRTHSLLKSSSIPFLENLKAFIHSDTVMCVQLYGSRFRNVDAVSIP